ncbi:hypothetical protein QOZ80_6AG0533420 [Eleusine coracana subsp. coracana]|nr:hypothetical protein QOZ80_6AG0533420 [Eleusine coracana subsp. coracana]
MAADWWWGFLVVNAIVAAVAFLSSRARPPPLPSPRQGGAAAITRRASSTVLQRLRSFSIFSFPSGFFHNTEPQLLPHPDAAQETEDKPAAVTSPIKSPARVPPVPALVPAAAEEEGDDPNAMSMEEAYALVVAARQRPESEREAEARQSEVDAKAAEFIEGFKEDLWQQRLNSIFNYTQMLKQRAPGRGRR